MLTALLLFPLAASAATEQQGVSEMPNMPMQRSMPFEQQAQLIRFAEVGLKWASGEMKFEDVIGLLGQANYVNEQVNRIRYAYYREGIAAYFYYDKLHLTDGKPNIDFFSIKIDGNLHTDIPRERIQERLKLQPVVRGELIDGVRTETSDFFVPEGRIVIPSPDPNLVGFNYRKSMSQDSVFDVNVGIIYLGEWLNESGGSSLTNLRKAIDLRELYISRHYLTHEELEQRDHAKRLKYGSMNLRTGMLCPETGWWQAWIDSGPNCKPFFWSKGRPFEPEFLPPPGPIRTVDARFTWVRSDNTAL